MVSAQIPTCERPSNDDQPANCRAPIGLSPFGRGLERAHFFDDLMEAMERGERVRLLPAPKRADGVPRAFPVAFTKGPWRDASDGRHRTGDRLDILDARGLRVASVEDATSHEGAANANLIKEAPALLEALVALLEERPGARRMAAQVVEAACRRSVPRLPKLAARLDAAEDGGDVDQLADLACRSYRRWRAAIRARPAPTGARRGAGFPWDDVWGHVYEACASRLEAVQLRQQGDHEAANDCALTSADSLAMLSHDCARGGEHREWRLRGSTGRPDHCGCE